MRVAVTARRGLDRKRKSKRSRNRNFSNSARSLCTCSVVAGPVQALKCIQNADVRQSQLINVLIS